MNKMSLSIKLFFCLTGHLISVSLYLDRQANGQTDTHITELASPIQQLQHHHHQQHATVVAVHVLLLMFFFRTPRHETRSHTMTPSFYESSTTAPRIETGRQTTITFLWFVNLFSCVPLYANYEFVTSLLLQNEYHPKSSIPLMPQSSVTSSRCSDGKEQYFWVMLTPTWNRY